MADIVTRLRDAQRSRESWDMHKEPLFGEAADEIERLRRFVVEDHNIMWKVISAIRENNGQQLREFVKLMEGYSE